MKPDAAVHGGGASGSISRDPCRVLLVSDDPAELRLIRSLFDDCAQIGTPLGPIALDSAGDYRQAAILARDFDYGAILLGRLGEPARADAVLRRARVEHGLPGPFLVLVDKPGGSDADSVPAGLFKTSAAPFNRLAWLDRYRGSDRGKVAAIEASGAMR